jgi:hypothetical protein
VDLDGLADDVEDAAQLVVVLGLHAQRVGHVAGGDRLGPSCPEMWSSRSARSAMMPAA